MPSFMLIGGAQPLWYPYRALHLPEDYRSSARTLRPSNRPDSVPQRCPGTGEQTILERLEKELQRQIKEVDISASQLPASSGRRKRKGSPSAGSKDPLPIDSGRGLKSASPFPVHRVGQHEMSLAENILGGGGKCLTNHQNRRSRRRRPPFSFDLFLRLSRFFS